MGKNIRKDYSSESVDKINALLFCRPSALSLSGNLLQIRDPGSNPRSTQSESEILKLAQGMCRVSKYEKCSPLGLICSNLLFGPYRQSRFGAFAVHSIFICQQIIKSLRPSQVSEMASAKSSTDFITESLFFFSPKTYS